MLKTKNASRRKRRQWHIRKKVSGTAAIPRMCVYRSLKNISVQLIDDVSGKTLVAATSLEKAFTESGVKASGIEAGAIVGKLAAEKALQAGITKVVFDRAGYKYHGRVKSLADAAREAGLQF
ncbi:MAG: 50S ribosomal protein L18 [Lentisphaeraceae bacterium]|nr:50S ribosomal protein L18 [Lentisphaeraceae bacterium]